jgi:hypothetical protein
MTDKTKQEHNEGTDIHGRVKPLKLPSCSSVERQLRLNTFASTLRQVEARELVTTFDVAASDRESPQLVAAKED